MCTAKILIKMYLLTILTNYFNIKICYQSRKLHDVVENWTLMFKLLVGGNLHICEILVFKIGFLGGYTALPKDFI